MASAGMISRTTAAAAAVALLVGGCASRPTVRFSGMTARVPDQSGMRLLRGDVPLPLVDACGQKIGQIPERTPAELLEALKSRDASARIAALHGIILLGSSGKAGPEFLDELLRAAGEKDAHIQHDAIAALEALRLNSEADRVRVRAKLMEVRNKDEGRPGAEKGIGALPCMNVR